MGNGRKPYLNVARPGRRLPARVENNERSAYQIVLNGSFLTGVTQRWVPQDSTRGHLVLRAIGSQVGAAEWHVQQRAVVQ
jgi:hypothetical protein